MKAVQPAQQGLGYFARTARLRRTASVDALRSNPSSLWWSVTWGRVQGLGDP